ncbi:hypothetical protein [Paraliomyxa miuraensis]|uniref:hypothetical protein n=1 Tax=Paraliomyxa miuraensis TaxID=376150 RepID=UPI0022594410|nr:hypothetical protein [Paraliomyxa miuraensis]MCX4244992.1 hypothetical protein [Paraliomyxa miuraensis]
MSPDDHGGALAAFFAQMKPYLLGQQALAPTLRALGPPHGSEDDFSFYRVLAERNLFKVMLELYGPLRTLWLRRQDELPAAVGTWRAMVDEYIAAHPPAGRHPNCFGEALPEFLAARRERIPEQPVVYEELADFCWIRTRAHQAPDDEGDGFDSRLFVRQYSYPIPDFVAALGRDSQAPVPEPQPRVLLVYRHWQQLQVRLFHPSAAGLVALARRQGVEVPAPLQAVPSDHVEIADAALVEHGVLGPRVTAPA